MTALTVCNQEGITTIDGTASRYEMMESWSQGNGQCQLLLCFEHYTSLQISAFH